MKRLGSLLMLACAATNTAAASASSTSESTLLHSLAGTCLALVELNEREFFSRPSETGEWRPADPFHNLDRLTLCFEALHSSRWTEEPWSYYAGTAEFVEMTNATGPIEVPFVATFDPHAQALRLALCHGSNCTTRILIEPSPTDGWLFTAEFSSPLRAGQYSGSLRER